MNDKSPQPTENNSPGLYYGYIVVSLCFIILMILFGAIYSFGVFFKPIIDEFGWSRTTVSGAYSLYMLLFGFFSILGGRLSDKFGAKLVITLGGIIIGASYLLMSQVSAIWQIYLLYGIFVSLGMANTYISILSYTIHWFVKNRGFATGIIISGVGVGLAIMPPFANHLIANYTWHTTYLIIGVLVLIMVVTFAQFLKSNPNQRISRAEEYTSQDSNTRDRQIQGYALGEAMRMRQFWILCILFFIASMSVQIIMVHLVPYATDNGISPADAAILLSGLGWTSIITKIVLGHVADRWGNMRSMFIAFIALLMAFLWLQFSRELWMLWLFVLLFAIGYGAEAVLRSPITAEFFGLKSLGSILGVITCGGCLGGAAGPLLAGFIFDITGSYYWTFVYCTISAAVGLTLILSLKYGRRKKKTQAIEQ